MVLYTGEAVRVQAKVIDPDTDDVLVLAQGDPEPTATIQLWSPGKNPAKDLTVRDSPDHGPEAMDYRSEESDFIVFVHTRGTGIGPDPTGTKWEAGKWSYRIEVTGSLYTNWEYGAFTLKP